MMSSCKIGKEIVYEEPLTKHTFWVETNMEHKYVTWVHICIDVMPINSKITRCFRPPAHAEVCEQQRMLFTEQVTCHLKKAKILYLSARKCMGHLSPLPKTRIKYKQGHWNADRWNDSQKKEDSWKLVWKSLIANKYLLIRNRWKHICNCFLYLIVWINYVIRSVKIRKILSYSFGTPNSIVANVPRTSISAGSTTRGAYLATIY